MGRCGKSVNKKELKETIEKNNELLISEMNLGIDKIIKKLESDKIEEEIQANIDKENDKTVSIFSVAVGLCISGLICTYQCIGNHSGDMMYNIMLVGFIIFEVLSTVAICGYLYYLLRRK